MIYSKAITDQLRPICFLQGECEFLIYFTEKPVEAVAAPGSPSVLTSVERVTAAIGSAIANPALLCDPKLTIGVDLK